MVISKASAGTADHLSPVRNLHGQRRKHCTRLRDRLPVQRCPPPTSPCASVKTPGSATPCSNSMSAHILRQEWQSRCRDEDPLHLQPVPLLPRQSHCRRGRHRRHLSTRRPRSRLHVDSRHLGAAVRETRSQTQATRQVAAFNRSIFAAEGRRSKEAEV
jgi:hypothetical protein